MSIWKYLRVPVVACLLAASCSNLTTQASAQDALEKIESAGEIKIGWAEWRPLEYRDTASGELKGFLIVLAEEVAKRLGVEASFVQDNWSTLPAGIASDKFQIALMAVTEAREKVLDFSKPLYHVPYSVIVRDSSDLATFDDVNTPDHIISVTTGSSTDELLTALVKSGELKAKVIRLKDVGGALLSMTTDKTTAFATTVDALSQIVEQQKAFRIVEGNFGASNYAIAHAHGQAALNAALNEAVTSMTEDNTVTDLLSDHGVAGSIAGAQE